MWGYYRTYALKNRLCRGLRYGRYLQFRFLKSQLTVIPEINRHVVLNAFGQSDCVHVRLNTYHITNISHIRNTHHKVVKITCTFNGQQVSTWINYLYVYLYLYKLLEHMWLNSRKIVPNFQFPAHVDLTNKTSLQFSMDMFHIHQNNIAFILRIGIHGELSCPYPKKNKGNHGFTPLPDHLPKTGPWDGFLPKIYHFPACFHHFPAFFTIFHFSTQTPPFSTASPWRTATPWRRRLQGLIDSAFVGRCGGSVQLAALAPGTSWLDSLSYLLLGV